MKKLVDAALVFILVVGLAYMVYLSRSDGSLFGTPTPTITFTATSTPAPTMSPSPTASATHTPTPTPTPTQTVYQNLLRETLDQVLERRVVDMASRP